MNDQACRERGTELFEIKESMSSVGKRLYSSLERISHVGNKLYDDSGAINGADIKKAPTADLIVPGTISDFKKMVEEFSVLANAFEIQVTKLEKLI